MAFGGSLYGGSFTTNCLDDIPFKLGPKFKPPTKVVLPSDFHLTSTSRALQEEYTFEVEEAVLKWSAEREKQRLELEISETNDEVDTVDGIQDQPKENNTDPLYANSQANNEPLYENTGVLLPKPAPRPKVKPKPKDEYVNVVVPNPIIANISNDILKPTPTGSPSESNGILKPDSEPGTKSNDIDLTWFEKEDDPFDNLELQTINDLEELASVLEEETKKVSPEPTAVQGDLSSNSPVLKENNAEQMNSGVDEQDDDDEIPNYENVELKLVDLKIDTKENIYENSDVGLSLTDIKNLPPVPPRRDLVGRSPPLPPIGQSSSEPALSKTTNQSSQDTNQQSDSSNHIDGSFQNADSAMVISKRRVPLPKPPRTFAYSRHTLEEKDSEKVDEPVNGIKQSVSISGAGSNLNVQFTNSQQTQDVNVRRQSSEGLNFVNHHFGEDVASGVNGLVKPQAAPRKAPVPPPRPPQPWNRYSPLPPTSGSTVEQPNNVSLPTETGNQPDVYSKLSTEAQSCVENLVSMGFQKDRVARAVEKIGQDEKEVVEYLCLVDQLIEKGYSPYLAENALLLFKNSMKQASAYLELFTQLQELGFNGDKIKEALINTNNDREKTLDILTAS